MTFRLTITVFPWNWEHSRTKRVLLWEGWGNDFTLIFNILVKMKCTNHVGALDEGSWYRMSILRNLYVALSNLRNLYVALSNLRNAHVALSNLRNCHVPMSIFFQISCPMSLRHKRPHVALSMLGVYGHNVMTFPSSIPCGPRLGPSWAKLGPKWAPDGPDWVPFGNAAWVGYCLLSLQSFLCEMSESYHQ